MHCFDEGAEDHLPDETQVVYVSPLKALSNDIRKNLQEPLSGIRALLGEANGHDIDVRAEVRTGDTTAAQRQALIKRPPHILVTTPESLYLLLTSESGRRMLGTARTLILDEIHAVVDDRRGAHLALSVERLAALVQGPLQRIGLSATQKPIEEVARFLVGTRAVDEAGNPDCEIIDIGHRRELDLAIEIPKSPLEAVMSNEVWEEVYRRLAELIRGASNDFGFRQHASHGRARHASPERVAGRRRCHFTSRKSFCKTAARSGRPIEARRIESARRYGFAGVGN